VQNVKERADEMKRDNQNFRYGASSATVLAGILVIVVLINAVVGVLAEKTNLKLDLTHNKLYEMTDITKNLLKNLKTDVNLYYVTEDNYEVKEIYDFAKLYTQVSPHVKLTKVDSKKDPAFLKKYMSENGTINLGSIIVESDRRYTIIDYTSMYDISFTEYGYQATGIKLENKLSNAIAYVTADVLPKIYFTTGHNELAYTEISSFLEGENMSLHEINLLSEDIPADCDILFIAGPRLDFGASEIDKIDEYFDRGGCVYLSLDVGTTLPKLTNYLTEWGINVGSDIIAEQDRNYYTEGIKPFILAQIQSHEITSLAQSQKANVLAPYCRSIGIEGNSLVNATPLLKTTDKAVTYEIRDNQILSEVSQEGSFNLLVYATRTSVRDTSKQGKLLLAGSSGIFGFTSSSYGFNILDEQNFANREIMAKALQETLESKIQILSIASKDKRVQKLVMSQKMLLVYPVIFSVVLPLAAFVWGLVVWIKRRHL